MPDASIQIPVCKSIAKFTPLFCFSKKEGGPPKVVGGTASTKMLFAFFHSFHHNKPNKQHNYKNNIKYYVFFVICKYVN